MANLFGKNKLRSIAQQIDTEEIKPLIEIVKEWHEDYHNGSLKRDKETSREQEYNQQFFKAILGYKEKPASPFSFEPKATTDKGQLPDAVISYTDTANDIRNTIAVVELKGAAIDLDRPQRRDGNMSPVQQGFKYKAQYRACPFVIVSNFWEFRLYHDNLLDYEVWTLDDLVNPDDDYILFKAWYALLKHDNFTTSKGASKTEALLSDIRIEQENIGKKFYKVYREARLDLLRDIYSNNEHVRDNIDIGIEKAQKIVDRIVFAAFAEDRGLLPDDTLQRVIKAADSSTFGGSLWNTLKGFFEAIDVGSEKLEIPDGYNGGLFKYDETLNNFRITDDPLRKVVELGTYNFSEDLSVNILGHIFEQSISDLEEIKSKVRESQNIESLAVSRRKKDGIFYTPDYIVRYIVDNSLGAYLREHEEKFKNEFGLKGDITDKTYEKREKQAYSKYQDFLQNIKVVDPACGSGAFLVYVFDYLLAENKRVSDIVGNSLFSSDTYVRDILRNNIYGVDLNEESVEITKLSLWLKTAQKGKKLTALDGNIKCGNSLIDDPNAAGDKAFNWHEEFADIFKNGGFDVVVGNPPYVNFVNLPISDRSYYKANYVTTKNKTDLYAFFIEQSTKLLKNGGYLSFIFPHTWSSTTSFQPLRRLVIENYSNVHLVELGHNVFKDAFVKTNIFSGKKSLNFKGIDIYDDDFRQKVFIPADILLRDEELAISFDWSSKKQSIEDKLFASSEKLGNVLKFTRGIKTSDDKRFLSNEKINEEYKKVVRGRNIKAYSVNFNGEYIWYRPDLIKEKVGSLPHSKDLFEVPEKLITQRVNSSGQLLVAYDDNQTYCLDTTNVSVGIPDDVSLKYILTILNSKLINWWFNDKYRMPTISGYELASIPIKIIIKNDQKTFEEFADSRLELTKELNHKSQSFKKLINGEYHVERWSASLSSWWALDFNDFTKYLGVKFSLSQKDELLQLFDKYKSELQSIDDEIIEINLKIDQLVYELYSLTPEEIAIVGGAN